MSTSLGSVMLDSEYLPVSFSCRFNDVSERPGRISVTVVRVGGVQSNRRTLASSFVPLP
jgi:hypothetical protein